jgi:hypothetical protein
MAALVIESGPRQGAVLALEAGTHVLGRSESCQHRFEDPTVSGRHCEVLVSPLGIRVRDLDSSNGITVDGHPVREADLLDGQRLGLGDFILRAVIPPVSIVIPALSEPEPTGPSFLSDGTPACHHHRAEPAAFRCGHCARTFCAACVHRIGLAGGPQRILCPACSNVCLGLDGTVEGGLDDSWRARLWRAVRTAFDFRSGQSRRRPGA